jgi:dienelactone hydrolase
MPSTVKAALGLAIAASVYAQPLPGTKELTRQSDLAMDMVASIDRYLMKRLAESPQRRPAINAESRERLKKLIGVVDPRVPFDAPAIDATLSRSAKIGEGPGYEILSIRWPALQGMDGEGLLLRPIQGPPKAYVIAIPDADLTPEQWIGIEPGAPAEAASARGFAYNGCMVVVPYLINRDDRLSVNDAIGKKSNQPHREFIHRMAYEMGRHIVGYEVQKVLAVTDWFERLDRSKPIGVYGYGEGGLLALYSAAIDERIKATVVSGYFNRREDVIWSEPIYRNVWSQLETWGDAELAMLAKSGRRWVKIVASEHPKVAGPPREREGRRGAATGKIVTPPFEVVHAEAQKALVPVIQKGPLGILEALGVDPIKQQSPPAEGKAHTSGRQERQFAQMVEFTQKLMRDSDRKRRERMANVPTNNLAKFEVAIRPYRTEFWEESQGKMPPATEPLSKVESRRSYDKEKFTGYDVVIPVWGEVYASGILLVPTGLKPGERRPVVVAQHGLEGRPVDVVAAPTERAKGIYKNFAAEMADMGFVVFAPQNPYIGMETFRVLMRKANPVKLSLFSFIIGQHDRIIDWLETLPYVDKTRIGFYGLSYGGKTAMRVPALVERYALSICSGDFNEWVSKVTSVDVPFSYMYTQEYDMLEFNLGHTFNYYEQAMMIAPRPFMVERGHYDGVGIDEWVSSEFAKVRRLYTYLGIGDRTTIEYFNGPHQIHGVGTYEFLRRHLRWPAK